MERTIRDGRVAVIYSPGYGAGWYTWHNVEELVYDPSIVYWVENNEYENIQAYMILKYPDVYVSELNFNLAIHWIPVGERFRIEEYDGNESVVRESNQIWLTA